MLIEVSEKEARRIYASRYDSDNYKKLGLMLLGLGDTVIGGSIISGMMGNIWIIPVIIIPFWGILIYCIIKYFKLRDKYAEEGLINETTDKRGPQRSQ